MYYESRAQAGRALANELAAYRYENVVVVALTDGAVQIGREIAAQLHCSITMLLVDDIEVPGEGVAFGTLNQSGRFTYNGMFSAGEIDEYYAEFHGYLDEQRRSKMNHMNQLLGAGGIVSETMLREQVVILVSDGLPSGASLDAAADFLKPLLIKKLVIAAPVASVEAVDRAHIIADELHIMGVTENYLETDHYYDKNDVPDHETTVRTLDDVVLEWQ